MKLKRFVAKKVYGYLEFNIEFNQKLSFLIGVNGSGKTTVLRLLQALLTPSIRDLLTIPFLEASIVYEDGGKEVSIDASKNKKLLNVKVSHIKEEMTLPNIDEDELEYILSRPKRSDEFFEGHQIKYSDHQVFRFISNINAPVFLGLERTHRGNLEPLRDYYYESEQLLNKSSLSNFRGMRMVKGSLAAGLIETQMLIQETFRNLRATENKYSDQLRENILISAISYPDFSYMFEDLESTLPSEIEKKEILGRREEIENALTNIGMPGDKIKSLLGSYFERLEKLFESLEDYEKSKGFPIEWFLNKTQIDRVTDLIRIIDDHKSNVDRLFFPINKFIDSVNSFYCDTKKYLSIDTVGQLLIERPDKRLAPIEALSSGERQLLIIFAHLLFNEYSSRSNVFIIDEPELSLHLKWQERFVEKAIEVSPNTQLVLATHSPEIVGDFEEKSISIAIGEDN